MLLSDLVTFCNDQVGVEVKLGDAIERMEYEGLSQVVLVKNQIAVGMLTLNPTSSSNHKKMRKKRIFQEI
jgi:predicted transcriptional regulator